jgi:GPI-anchor transamidase subunit T
MTFEPFGDHGNASDAGLHLLHGTLPREVVCTENLTPFLKLLPCKGKAGIASLLSGHKVFDASWQSMGIDFWPICPAGSSECIVAIEQTVDMVLDIERSKRPRDNPIPRPLPADNLICDTSKEYASDNTCYPLGLKAARSWSLLDVFGRPIVGTCLSSGEDTTPVCLNVPDEQDAFTVSGVGDRRGSGGFSRCYTIPETELFELVVPDQPLNSTTPLQQSPLYAERFITGHGQERGGIQIFLTNPSDTSAIEFVYFESLPWFMKPYLYTLQVQTTPSVFRRSDIIQSIYYRPGLDRKRGTQLELLMSIPPACTVILTYDFEKAILRYTEYPPDANRGFDVAPAVIRLLDSHPTEGAKPMYLRTPSLLLPLPTPDFSMPYNVIILTSTVIALAFGSIFNLLVRRFVGADELDGDDNVTAIKKWIRRQKANFAGRGMEKKVQ